MDTDLVFLRRLVREIARSELLPRLVGVQEQTKSDGSAVTEADLAMQDRLQSALARHWPNIGFLGEEMTGEEHEQLIAGQKKALWCLDPLDGTTNYVCGLPFYAVSLALLVENMPHMAVVYDPMRDECFSAMRGAGAWINEGTIRTRSFLPTAMSRCVAVVDFKRLDGKLAARLGSNPPFGSQRNFGSSALEWCWLACGRFHLYLHGGQKLWDYAAGSLVLAEAGGRSLTLNGEPVFAMLSSARSVVAAMDANLFKVWSQWLAEAG